MDTRRLLLGDWAPIVRDGIDVLRLAFVGATIGALASGHSATNAAVSTAAAVAARFANLPRPYDLSLVLAMGLTGFGDAFGAYRAFGYYDTVVHFLAPLFLAPVVYILFARVEVLREMQEESHGRHRFGIFVVTFALGLSIGALWEGLEWSSDHLFGSHLQLGLDDTMGDLAADGAGAAVGGLLLVAWTLYGWGSVRRIPGENRAEQTRA
jgi:hypothetical protein